MIRCKNEN